MVYGITNIGLADQIEDTKEEAQKLIDGFKAGLTGYLTWEASVHAKIMTQGYIETALGRKRRFGETIAEAQKEDLWKKKKWHWKIERCKRQSTNAEIQGSSADQTKKAIVAMSYPERPDGTTCLDRDEWLENGYVSLTDEIDVHMILQVHDELVFDAPLDVAWEDLQRIAHTMANAIPNDAGVEFKSDIEASPYWGGKFSPEQVGQILEGKLDWTTIFQDEVVKKLAKFGIEYKLGDFAEVDEDEESDEYSTPVEEVA